MTTADILTEALRLLEDGPFPCDGHEVCIASAIWKARPVVGVSYDVLTWPVRVIAASEDQEPDALDLCLWQRGHAYTLADVREALLAAASLAMDGDS